MHKRAFTVLVVLVILLAGSLYATRAAANRTAGPQDGIQITDARGWAIKVVPNPIERTGPEQKITSPGNRSFSDLGYGDVELPVDQPYELFSVSYGLPEDVRQGPELWYVLHARLYFEFLPTIRGGSSEFSAFANGAFIDSMSLSGVYDPYTEQQTVTWGTHVLADGRDEKARGQTTDSSVYVDFSAYLPGVEVEYNGVQPGSNSLAFRVSHRDGQIVSRAVVLADSYVEVTGVPPAERRTLSQQLEGQPLLPEQDFARARDVVLADPAVQELLAGKGFTFDFAASWDLPQTETQREIRVDISLDRPYEIEEYVWPWPPAPVRTKPISATTRWVEAMTIVISGLDDGQVLGIMPERHPGVAMAPYEPDPTVPRLTAEQKARATELALAHPTVQRLLAGKTYLVEQLGPWYLSADNTLVGAAVELRFRETLWIEKEWLMLDFSEQGRPFPYYSVRPHREGYYVEGFVVLVDFWSQTATAVMPRKVYQGVMP